MEAIQATVLKMFHMCFDRIPTVMKKQTEQNLQPKNTPDIRK